MTSTTITIIVIGVLVLIFVVLLDISLMLVASMEDDREEEFIREYYRKYGCYPWDVPTADNEIEPEEDI